ncbi:MAG: DUF4430 domain-containing protein [Candidatus Bathyarchaeia archaeon]
MSEDDLKYLAAFLLIITIIASSVALYYYYRYNQTLERYRGLVEELDDLTLEISIKIDYGNGTSLWYNNTRVPLNASLLSATNSIADISYTRGEYGAFVNAINGVSNREGKYWLWSYFDRREGEWRMGTVAADLKYLDDGDILVWIYTET